MTLLRAQAPSAAELRKDWAQALLEREWLDQPGTLAGRLDQLCRYAVLFGDPSARVHCRWTGFFTSPPVRSGRGGARLRPDNLGGAGLRPSSPSPARRQGQDGEEGQARPAAGSGRIRTEPGSHRRRCDHGLSSAALASGAAPCRGRFPAPSAAPWASGLTVLRCHRPGQQVVAVRDQPGHTARRRARGVWTASLLLDGGGRLCPRAPPRVHGQAAKEFAAELNARARPCGSLGRPPGGACLTAGTGFPVAQSAGLVAEGLRGPPMSSDSEIERLVRNRLDGHTASAGESLACARSKQLAQELFRGGRAIVPATLAAPRRPWRGWTRPGVRAFYQARGMAWRMRPGGSWRPHRD